MTNPSEFQEEVEIQANDPNYFGNILEQRLSRRQTLMGGIGAAAAAVLGSGVIAGCTTNDDETPVAPAKLGFTAIDKNRNDLVTVPDGYDVAVLWALGDTFGAGVTDTAWSDAGTETAESYNRRAGDHHDGMYYFGLAAAGSTPDRSSSTRGVLAMNHEAINFYNSDGSNSIYVHANGASSTGTGASLARTVVDEVRKEVNHHGCSLVEVKKTGSEWAVVKGSALNRRVTAATEIRIAGPLNGNDAMKTKFSPTGVLTRGTVNNCSVGYTPWGTFLTCEENWAGYFFRSGADDAARTAGEVASLKRYGNGQGALQRLRWNTAAPEDVAFPGEFARWDTSVIGATAADDYRNAINTFGFVVEIDPYNAGAMPAKRTRLGRLAHEGAWPAKVTAGKPLVWYMGDDNRGDYIYKYVSTANWDPADANAADRMAIGDKYLDSGKLYVAKFNADGSGAWTELTGTDAFLNTRLAADAAGATRMDRPEWATVHPITGEVYVSLTNSNSANRIATGAPGPTGPASAPTSSNSALLDAANPRRYNDPKGVAATAQIGNPNGHIIRFREDADNPAAIGFSWDIYLFGAASDADAVNVNVSGLAATNDFSSPDGMWFSRPSNAAAGILWIQTDDSAYTDVTNCMMLAALPGKVGDGASITIDNAGTPVNTRRGAVATDLTLRRFLVGPKECEITGIDTTPDGKTMFVNIQHPGEETIPASFANPASYGSRWPGSQFGSALFGQRPRSATIVITRKDGGVVGL